MSIRKHKHELLAMLVVGGLVAACAAAFSGQNGEAKYTMGHPLEQFPAITKWGGEYRGPTAEQVAAALKGQDIVRKAFDYGE